MTEKRELQERLRDQIEHSQVQLAKTKALLDELMAVELAERWAESEPRSWRRRWFGSE